MAKPAKNAVVSTYQVLRRILYNGDTYNAGETVDMSADEAASLLKLGAIAIPVSPPAPATPAKS